MQETELYKHVTDILSSEKLGCPIKKTLGHGDSLPNIAAAVCCQGAGILTGKFGSSDMFCCKETCVRCYRAINGDKPVTVVSGKVVNGNGEQGVDMLVPLSQKDSTCCNLGSCGYSGMHPASNDVLTALLLALPPQTWSGIKDAKTLEEVSSLVSTVSLRPLLQEEVNKFIIPMRILFFQTFVSLVLLARVEKIHKTLLMELELPGVDRNPKGKNIT